MMMRCIFDDDTAQDLDLLCKIHFTALKGMKKALFAVVKIKGGIQLQEVKIKPVYC